MRYPKIFLCAIAIIISTIALSQNEEIVEIEKLKDKATGIGFVKVAIPIWNINIANYNMSIYDIPITAHIQIKDRVYLAASYTLQLGERLYPDVGGGDILNSSSESALSVYEKSHSNAFHLEGTYFFTQKLKTEDLTIRLKSTSYGSRTVTKITYVQGEQLTRFGLRLGFTKGITWYGIDDLNLVGIDKTGEERNLDMQQKSTMIRYTNLHIGIGRAKQTNLHVNAKNYGYRTNAGFDYLYADVILSLKSQLDDVFASYYFDGQGTMYYRRYEIDSHAPKSKLGLALGFRSIPFVGIGSFDIEAGAFTGLKGEGNGYLKLGFNLAIGSSEKIKQKKNGTEDDPGAPKDSPRR